MKKITAATLFFIPVIVLAQEHKNSLGISGGFEFQDSKTLAWNVMVNYNKPIQKSQRWFTEYGFNLYVLEHRHANYPGIPQDSTLVYPTYGAIVYPGYLEINDVYYSRTIGIRLQTGVNYNIIKKDNFTFSAGLNVVNDILLDYKENGQKKLFPVAGYGDTLPFREYHYSIHRKTATADNPLSLQIQPHVDCSILLSEYLLLNTRLGCYIQLVRELQFVRPQANVGIVYRW